MLQISNVFINVSKGQVANSDDLNKAFGKMDVNDIVKEVGSISFPRHFISDAATCEVLMLILRIGLNRS